MAPNSRRQHVQTLSVTALVLLLSLALHPTAAYMPRSGIISSASSQVSSRNLKQAVFNATAEDSGIYTSAQANPVQPYQQQSYEAVLMELAGGAQVAEVITTTLFFKGISMSSFQTQYQATVASVTARVTGTPATAWQFELGGSSSSSDAGVTQLVASQSTSTSTVQSPTSDISGGSVSTSSGTSSSTDLTQTPAVDGTGVIAGSMQTAGSSGSTLVSAQAVGLGSSSVATDSTQIGAISIDSAAAAGQAAQPLAVGNHDPITAFATQAAISSGSTSINPVQAPAVVTSTGTFAGRRNLLDHPPSLLQQQQGQVSSAPSTRISKKLLQQQQQQDQGLLVSLTLSTWDPALVVYRLSQPPATAAALSRGCRTEYCARLLAANLPVDTSSISITPDMDMLVAAVRNTASTEAAKKQQKDRVLGGAIGGAVGGVLLLAAAAFAGFRLVKKRTAGCNSAPAANAAADKDVAAGFEDSIAHCQDAEMQRMQSGRTDLDTIADLQMNLSDTSLSNFVLKPIRTKPVDVSDTASIVTTSTAVASTSTSIIAPSAAPSSAPSAGPSATSGPVSEPTSTAGKHTEARGSFRSRMFRSISQLSMTSSAASVPAVPEASTQDDGPGTPTANFYEDEEVADKLLRTLVSDEVKNKVAGGRLVLDNVDELRRVQSERPSPRLASAGRRGHRRNLTFGGGFDASFADACGGGSFHTQASEPGARLVDQTAVDVDAAVPVPVNHVPGFMTPPAYPAGLSAQQSGFLSVPHTSSSPPLVATPSQSMVDPVALYQALQQCYVSLQQVHQLVSPKVTPGHSPVQTPRVAP